MVRELGPGGSERQLAETAGRLDRKRFVPHVACFRAPGIRAEGLERAGVPICALPVRSFRGPSAIRGAIEFRRYLRRHKIQLVHTFDTPSNMFGVPLARLNGTPVVLSSQRAHRDLTHPWERRLLRFTDRLVDGIVVNCQFLADHLVRDEKVTASRIHLCRNSIDLDHFQPGDRRRMPPLENSGLVIGTVCALRPEKRLDVLVDAFAKVAAPGRKLVIVGSGPMQPALEGQIRRLALEPYCHMEPTTPTVAAWLRSIDIFVLPSTTEGLSNSLMEAMASGCTVAASDVGGNPELITPGKTGFLFPAGDPERLAAILRELAANPSLRRSQAEAAARWLREGFHPGISTARIEQIYEQHLEAYTVSFK